MKLLLTSAGMRMKDEILKILPKSPQELKLALIPTASNVEQDTTYLERDRSAFIELGFDVEEVDLEGVTTEQLRNRLLDKDVIYVEGGNTFHLLKHVRESGFEIVLRELLENGLIYIGVSAGSIIAGKSVEKAVGQDSNDAGMVDFIGMNLIDRIIDVHCEVGGENPDTGLVSLTDDQAIFVDGEDISIISR